MELQYAQPPSHEDILRVIRRNLNTEPSCEKVSCIEMSFLLQMVDLERRNMVFPISPKAPASRRANLPF